jgi:hypothetical protein
MLTQLILCLGLGSLCGAKLQVWTFAATAFLTTLLVCLAETLPVTVADRAFFDVLMVAITLQLGYAGGAFRRRAWEVWLVPSNTRG